MDEIDETREDQPQSDPPQPTPLMPLSMPPMGPLPEVATPGDRPTTEVSPRALDTALMPLSMPPFGPPPVGPPPLGPPPAMSGGAIPSDGRGSAPAVSRRSRGVVLLAVVALLAGGLGGGLGAAFSGGGSTPAGSAQPIPAASALPPAGATTTSRVYARVEPAVVDINTNVASVGSELEQAAGTGMIVTSSGEVLTNNHVVDDATTITVTVQGHRGPVGGRFNAKLLGDDPIDDVALIQIEGITHLPHVAIGNSSALAVGDAVYALGNALGLGGQPSVQSGVVSALHRSISANNEFTNVPETLHGLIQTNAAIQSGDSGGPLVDRAGQVVGMDTAAATTDGSSAEPVGFAIPINEARTIGNRIAAGKAGSGVNIGYAAFLGVDIEPSNGFNDVFGNSGQGGFSFNIGGLGNSGSAQATPTVAGAQITAIVPHSAAANAGLVAGDVITAIGGTKITAKSASVAATEVTNALATHKPGDVVAITFVNTSGATETLHAKLSGIPR